MRESLLVLLGQLLPVAGMLVGVRLLTELMPPAAYGELVLGATLATLMNQTVFGPLANSSMRFYAPATESDSFGSYLASIWRLARYGLVAIAGVFVVVSLGLVVMGRTTWLPLGLASIAFATATGIASVIAGVQNGARRRMVVAFHQTLDAWLRLGLAVAFLVVFGTSSLAAMLGYALAGALVLASQYWFYRRLVRHRSQWSGVESSTEVWGYTWPFVAWGIFTWAQAASDRWGIEWFASRDDVGYLGVLGQFGYGPIQLATGIAVQFVAPILFQRAGRGEDPVRNREVARMSRVLTIIMLSVTAVAVFVAFLLHGRLFEIFIAAEYAPASYLLPWVILAGGIFAAAQSVSLGLMTQLRVRVMLVAKIATAIVGVALNLTGAYFYGIEGVVAASVIFSTTVLVWMLVLARATREPTAS